MELAVVLLGLAFPLGVAAHGVVTEGPPTVANLLFGWTFEPAVVIPLLAALLVWRYAVRRVNAEHPANPVPRIRSVAFYGALAAVAVALDSGIDRYDTVLFSIHMVQHLLLTLVAAPLFALSAPITLLLRLSSPATRRRWILPVLHSRVMRTLSFPVVSWLIFAGGSQDTGNVLAALPQPPATQPASAPATSEAKTPRPRGKMTTPATSAPSE